MRPHVLFACLACLLLAARAATPLPPADTFLVGADVSALAVHEDNGALYYNGDKEADALVLLRARGVNCFRLRLFVSPNHEETVVNDLDYTLRLARRVKATGAKLLLDLHYSDTWADPEKQFKPADWKNLPEDKLRERVRSYTRKTLQRFAKKGLMPDYVQIGNEITNGMLWPEGHVEFSTPDDTAAWDRLAGFLRAGAEGLREAAEGGTCPRIILHIESTGNLARSRWWLRNAIQRDVPFDLLGLSYYPEWHGTPAGLAETMAVLAEESSRPVIIAETAYPWKPDEHWAGRPNMAWPFSPEGQLTFLREILTVAHNVPARRGAGLFYWYPEAIRTQGLHTWVGGSCGLFDDQGRILPAASFALKKTNDHP